ncbi:MAG: hypothetical protein ACPG47_05675 [Leucothrix sp.]
MNKKIFPVLAILTGLLFGQAAFAEQFTTQDLNQKIMQELTREDLLDSTQDYVMEETVRPQARRSPLFAHILDAMVKNATMAKVDTVLTKHKG